MKFVSNARQEHVIDLLRPGLKPGHQLDIVSLNILKTGGKHFKGVGAKALRIKAGWENDSLRLILKHILDGTALQVA